MIELPRIVVAAPASSQGKTTISVGLMAALRQRGLAVAPFKVGPDYIDPGYHALAAGRVGRNLDVNLCGQELVGPLLAHGACTPSLAQVAIIEGVMGLFDGKLGTLGEGSTAQVAALIDAPVLLVVDGAHSSRTTAATALGMASFDPGVRVGGVIANRVSSPRVAEELRTALATVGLPLLGAVPRSRELVVPSRHLGLVPAAERSQAQDEIDAVGRLLARHIDLDAVLALAGSAPPLDAEPWQPGAHVQPVGGVRPRIAVAGGRAFTFRYPEVAELLTAAGCEVVEFDPLNDQQLPDHIAGLYLGGGFPQTYAGQLSGNAELRAQLAAAVQAGLPTVAECAGLLYLCRSLDGIDMAGVLPWRARMSAKLTLGYREPVSVADTLLTRAGETVRSHEFHRTTVAGHALPPAWHLQGRLDGASLDPAGVGAPTVHASYQHVHWAGYPAMAQRFAQAAAWFGASSISLGHHVTSTPTPPRNKLNPEPSRLASQARLGDLAHHGDQDLRPGLIDMAVNLRDSQPPRWLADTLRANVASWAAYPDPTDARARLSARHGVQPECVLPTAGGTEAFTLIAAALQPRCPVVVHPGFTEPEQALWRAGHRPLRVILSPESGFRLDPSPDSTGVDDQADLVVIGNPTNPTSVLHPAAVLNRLRRPGRVLVVDEAFMDAVPGEPETMIGPDLTGLLVVRSLTKMWSLAGVRAGYVVGDPTLIDQLAAQQPPWSVSAPALTTMIATATPAAQTEAHAAAVQLGADRARLVSAVEDAGFPVVAEPAAPFVLVDTSPAGPHSLRPALAEQGFAVRGGESFPGLGAAWLRLAVRDATTNTNIANALHHLLIRRKP